MKQCSSIADIESEMEHRIGGRQQPELAPCYRNLLRRISRCTACWNRRGKLASLAPFLPFSLPRSVRSTLQPCIPLSRRVSRGDSLKCKPEPWRCALAFRSGDNVFHWGLTKRKGVLVGDDQPRETVAKDNVEYRGTKATLRDSLQNFSASADFCVYLCDTLQLRFSQNFA